MERKCKNPWCEVAGKVRPAAFALCPTCWSVLGGIFTVLVVMDVLESWKPWAAWAFVAAVLGGAGVWFAVARQRLNGKAGPSVRGKVEASDGPRSGSRKRYRRWLRAGAFFVLVVLGVVVAKEIVVGASRDVLSMLL